MKISRFTYSILLLLFASGLVAYSLTLPDLDRTSLLIEGVAIWVLVILTIRTYLQETKPKVTMDALYNAGWIRDAEEISDPDPDNPYGTYQRGLREVLIVHLEDVDLVNYSDGEHYWKDEDIRGGVIKTILRVPDTHTHDVKHPSSEARTRAPGLREDVSIKVPEIKTTRVSMREQKFRTSETEKEKNNTHEGESKTEKETETAPDPEVESKDLDYSEDIVHAEKSKNQIGGEDHS